MRNIRVAVAGIGNCASSLIQGLEYYRERNEQDYAGLMHSRIGEWRVGDIEIVAAFDIDCRKVGSRWRRPFSRSPTVPRCLKGTCRHLA